MYTNAMAKGVEEKEDGVNVTYEVKVKKKQLKPIMYLSLLAVVQTQMNSDLNKSALK